MTEKIISKRNVLWILDSFVSEILQKFLSRAKRDDEIFFDCCFCNYHEKMFYEPRKTEKNMSKSRGGSAHTFLVFKKRCVKSPRHWDQFVSCFLVFIERFSIVFTKITSERNFAILLNYERKFF